MHEIIRRLRAIKPGEKVTYHTGELDLDRNKNREVHVIANVAYSLYLENKLLLLQKRDGPPTHHKKIDYTNGKSKFIYYAVGAYPKRLHVPFITDPLPSIREKTP